MTTEATANLLRYLVNASPTGRRRGTGIPVAIVLKRLLGVPLAEAAAMCRSCDVAPETLVPRRIQLED